MINVEARTIVNDDTGHAVNVYSWMRADHSHIVVEDVNMVLEQSEGIVKCVVFSNFDKAANDQHREQKRADMQTFLNIGNQN